MNRRKNTSVKNLICSRKQRLVLKMHQWNRQDFIRWGKFMRRHGENDGALQKRIKLKYRGATMEKNDFSKDLTGVKFKRVRLGWDESKEHYLALDDIENKHQGAYVGKRIGNGLKKRIKAKIHNDTIEYLRSNEIEYDGISFLKVVME